MATPRVFASRDALIQLHGFLISISWEPTSNFCEYLLHKNKVKTFKLGEMVCKGMAIDALTPRAHNIFILFILHM